MQLPLRLDSSHGRIEKDIPVLRAGKDSSLTFSIIIPCFNQGRFLIECLESLVQQSEHPGEVIVVNDGSTDEQSCKLFERLPHYHYPFPVHVLHKPNGGLSSARNFGIARCTGDIVLPLDADDIIMPIALESYRKAFINEPAVDAFYPDTITFGNKLLNNTHPHFNSWRITQENPMVSSTAMRRRIFNAGYWYDERMRRGYEDWEFAIRTFALGPFQCAPLKKLIFGYRHWGFSMVSAVDSEQAIAQIHSLHAEAGIWSTNIEKQLRKNHAPTHCLVCQTPAQFEDADDMIAIGVQDVETFLADNLSVRFLWLGSVSPEARPFLQLTLNETAARLPAPAYAFRDAGSDQPFLIALDRNWVLQHPFRRNILYEDLSGIVVTSCQGKRHPSVQKITRERKASAGAKAFLSSLQVGRIKQLLPPTHESDVRTLRDLRYYLAREPALPRFLKPDKNGSVLAIAMPKRDDSSTCLAIRHLIEEGSLRKYFKKTMIFTFEDGLEETFASLEPLFDAGIHLGNMGLVDSRKLELTLSILQAEQVNHLLIVESSLGYQMIPVIRKAKVPIRISAQIHELPDDPGFTRSSAGRPALLATQYANLIDCVAGVSDTITARMVDEYYFPAAKIKTVKLGMVQGESSCTPKAYAREMLAWIFSDQTQSARANWSAVFGFSDAA